MESCSIRYCLSNDILLQEPVGRLFRRRVNITQSRRHSQLTLLVHKHLLFGVVLSRKKKLQIQYTKYLIACVSF